MKVAKRIKLKNQEKKAQETEKWSKIWGNTKKNPNHFPRATFDGRQLDR